MTKEEFEQLKNGDFIQIENRIFQIGSPECRYITVYLDSVIIGPIGYPAKLVKKITKQEYYKLKIESANKAIRKLQDEIKRYERELDS